MTEVYFYHLTRSPLEAALPGLLETILGRNMCALVRLGAEARLRWLDDRLWSFRDESFLPHAVAGGAHDEAQPVLLTAGEGNVNDADILILVDGARYSLAELSDYKRVCLFFDGNDEQALSVARADWKEVTGAGVAAQYHAQEDNGWSCKATSPAA